MSRDPNCVFCKIVAGDIPSFTLFEDDATLAFMDINPANEGHALVIPKEHAIDLYEISDETLTRTIVTAKKVAGALARTLNPDGLNLVQCNGRAAAQSVMHFHVHVLPRVNDDRLAMNWGLKLGDIDAIGRMAERIRVWL